MQRVLKPGGRVLAVDFGEPFRKTNSLLSHFHWRYGHVHIRDIVAVLSETDLKIIESGAVEIADLQFVLAAKHAGHALKEPKP
jgi:ubiquinone/menaquinone biosynthesis C-methylase UbiE